MVRRERSRRAFLVGAAGLGGGAVPTSDRSRRGAPAPGGASAVGVPGLDTRHEVRWTFDPEPDEATVYPVVRTGGTVVALVRADTDGEAETEATHAVHGIDAASGEERWRYELDGRSTVPTAAAGRVYVADDDELVALDAESGDERWRFHRDGLDFENVAVGDDAVFVAWGARTTALDAESGDERWTTEVRNNGRLRDPLLTDDRVYLGGTTGFYALDRETGREQWFSDAPDRESVRPGGVRDGLLVGWSDAAVYGVRADGTRRWRTAHERLRPYGRIGALAADTAYVSGTTLAAVDLRTGEKRWTFEPEGGWGHAPTVADGTVYCPLSASEFVAVDADSGRERWRADAGAPHAYWGGVADGLVYVVTDDGVAAFDAESGRERWRLDREDLDGESALWASVSGDTAFVATGGGTLYAVDRPSPLATQPVETAAEFAASPPGLGLLGLLGAGLLATGYRLAGRRDRGADADDVTYGRLDRLDGGSAAASDSSPVTETYRKRVRTPSGPRLVAETRLTDDADPETRRAFAAAVQRWADLDADGVLPVRRYDLDPDAGTDSSLWFETPCVSGEPHVPAGSLADAWPVARRDRVEVASGVARALHAAHREGVAHGRLAPRHVVLAPPSDGARPPRIAASDVLVGGWFLAEALADVREDADPYAPPESEGEGERGDVGRGADARGDVYRVAALASHLLTGAVPDPDPAAARSRTPGSDGERDAGDLDAVLARGLAADPDERYETALAFDDAFRWAALDR